MLKRVTDGVMIHQSEFCQSNSVVVQGPDGVLVVDPGITADELTCLATDLAESGQTVKVGFSTHPHWDHLLWDARLGAAPRYGTARCAETIKGVLASAQWKDRVTTMLPPDIADQIPLDDLFGQITGLPAGEVQIPWNGPEALVIEHQGHAAGHAALLIKDPALLIAGDMLSDVLVPILNFNSADPTQDYLLGLEVLETLDANLLIPGHGSVAEAGQIKARIEQDRAYVEALRDGRSVNDSRIGPGAQFNWVRDVHERQLKQLAGRL